MKSLHKPWYKEKKPHEAVFNTVERIDEAQSYRYDQNLENLRFYSNRLVAGLYGSDYAMQDSGDRLKVNVVQSVIDTANAHLATNRPKPLFVTDDGDYSARRKAKDLTQFIEGSFHYNNQYETSLDIFRDAAISGIGVNKITPDPEEGRICSERVFFDAIIVDDIESRLRKPRNLYEYREVSREVLASAYPNKRAIIEDAERKARGDEITSYARLGQLRDHHDPVTVYEAWHLPSGPGKKDGRHVVCVSSGTLVDEVWERDDFPFAFWNWKPAVLGFYGVGIVEELKSIQIEINYLLQKIQQLMNLNTSQIWLHESSKTNTRRMTNMPMQINYYSGQPPIFANPPPVAAEYFMQVERLIQRAFEQIGISQLAAQSQKPAGLNSGTALRTYNDIGNKRFMEVLQRWENYHVEIGRKYVRAAKELDGMLGEGFKVLSRGKKKTQTLKWKDVDLEEDRFIMKPFPVSLMPDTPSGQIEQLRELREIKPELAEIMVREITAPDVDAAVGMITAPVDLVDMLFERMLDHGEYRQPDIFMPLDLIAKRGRQTLLQAEINGAPEENLSIMRRFLAESVSLKERMIREEQEKQMAMQAQAQMQAQAMQPQSAPPTQPQGEELGALPNASGEPIQPVA